MWIHVYVHTCVHVHPNLISKKWQGSCRPVYVCVCVFVSQLISSSAVTDINLPFGDMTVVKSQMCTIILQFPPHPGTGLLDMDFHVLKHCMAFLLSMLAVGLV